MKKPFMISALAALMLGGTACAGHYEQASVHAQVASPGAAVSVSYFYEDLDPYGRWIDYSPYGWCWTPYDVAADWRPYSDGYWAYTEFGWSWISYEPYSWAVYHYGRWLFDPMLGWVWVPDTVWAPAWVAWQYSDDWVGWAPLPPSASWDISFGLRWVSDSIPPSSWCFVERRYALDPTLRFQMASVGRNVTLLRETRDATRYVVRKGRPVNHGIDVAVMETLSGRKAKRLKVVDADSPNRTRKEGVHGSAVEYFRPEIRGSGRNAPPPGWVAEKGPAMPGPEMRRQGEIQQRKLEASLAEERARLQREQERELRSRPSGKANEDLRARHAAEKQALEKHAQEQRQALQQRLKKNIVKPESGKQPPKQKQDKGKGKSSG